MKVSLNWLRDYVPLTASPEEIARAFSQLRTEGKVRWFGVSNFKPSQVAALQSALDFPLIANQVEISLGALSCFDDGTLDQCLSAKMTPLAWSPLAKGRLAGAPQTEQDARLFTALDAIAARHGVSRAAIAIAWLLKHPSRMIPIIGTLNPGRIAEAVAAAEDSVAEIADALAALLQLRRVH